jgi:hypothetical protein
MNNSRFLKPVVAILIVAVLVTIVHEARTDGGDNPLKREVP